MKTRAGIAFWATIDISELQSSITGAVNIGALITLQAIVYERITQILSCQSYF
jgi:hypothetical protein